MKRPFTFYLFTVLFLVLTTPLILAGRILPVGPGKTYASPALAARDAVPGDTVLIFPAIYTGGNFIENLHGTENAPIYFIGTDAETVVFSGGSQSFHFSDVSYIHIENMSITGQTGNGMNIDDGGTFDTPTHHITIKNCRFYDMGAQGNNDMLKLSGIDYFTVSGCTLRNGATGGSGIDMVGCHHGVFENNFFQNMGSNSIQAKGGTQFIVIRQNWFESGGQRTLNLGGSTGLQFFRPLDAPFEAADIDVYANVLIGSWAPIAYVGCVRVKVVNNTIINPQNWIIRILQETVDPTRFQPCGDNSFINNIVYYGNSLSRHVNIGSNTAPETFVFSNNLWYNADNPGQSMPQLPVTENNAVIGQNPGFVDFGNRDFSLTENSPALDKGLEDSFTNDYDGEHRPSGPAFDIGAFEFIYNTTATENQNTTTALTVSPNPFLSSLRIHNRGESPIKISLRDIFGRLVSTSPDILPGAEYHWDLSFLPGGMYLVEGNKESTWVVKW